MPVTIPDNPFREGVTVFSDEFRALINQMAAILARYEAIEDEIESKIMEPEAARPMVPFLAHVAGEEDVGEGKRTYTLNPVDVAGDYTKNFWGSTPIEYTGCVNIAEFAHSAGNQWGVNIGGPSYPDGFSPVSPLSQVVLAWHMGSPEGSGIQVVFYAFGSHDGTCDEAPP